VALVDCTREQAFGHEPGASARPTLRSFSQIGFSDFAEEEVLKLKELPSADGTHREVLLKLGSRVWLKRALQVALHLSCGQVRTKLRTLGTGQSDCGGTE
jgi:hypothetical protein